MTIDRLADRLGYTFADSGLLDAALTHRSFGSSNNERLEFLGDAVLSSVIAHALYSEFPTGREGELSRKRAALVRQEGLVLIAQNLRLGDYLKLGEGERRAGGDQRASILADAMEGIIGAVYLDGGYGAAQTLILHLFSDSIKALSASDSCKDAKTSLQELLQSQGLLPPRYSLLAARGQDHEQEFEAGCDVPEFAVQAVGTGRSRRIAEQVAASKALDILQERLK